MAKGKTRKGRGGGLLAGAASAGGSVAVGAAFFLLILLALFLMIVSVSCVEVGVEFTREREPLWERVLSLPLTGTVALVVVAVTSALMGMGAAVLQVCWEALLAGKPLADGRRGAVQNVVIAIALIAVGLLVGGWRLQAGLDQADEGWAMQGTVIASLTALLGVLLLLPNLWLAVRPARARGAAAADRGTDHPSDGGGDGAKSDDGGQGLFAFAFLACLGIVASFGVAHWIRLSRAQDGEAPLPVGAYVHGKLTNDGFQNYPEKADLVLPEGLVGPHTVSWVDVAACDGKLVDQDGQAVPKKNLKAPESYTAFSFEAVPSRRYRLLLSRSGSSFCLYGIKLRRGIREAGGEP